MWSDDVTHGKVRAALLQAVSTGADPVLLLDRKGLLWSEHMVKVRTSGAVDDLALLLDEATIKQLSLEVPKLRPPLTPLDTKRVIAAWLHEQSQKMLQQGGER